MKYSQLIHQGCSADHSICNGGGGCGKGDGGAALREAQRQQRIASGTNAVNRIFGIGDDQAAAQRAGLYDATRNDTRQFFTSQLEEDRDKAMRDLKFQQARMGIIGSSQANDLDAEFQRRYDRGLLDVANRADSAATQFRTSDEQARLNLISKIVAGVDQGSAVQNAMNTMQTNANAAKEAYQGQRMGNVFADLLNSYQGSQYNAGMQSVSQQQNQNQTGNFFNTGASGADGSVTKS